MGQAMQWAVHMLRACARTRPLTQRVPQELGCPIHVLLGCHMPEVAELALKGKGAGRAHALHAL